MYFKKVGNSSSPSLVLVMMIMMVLVATMVIVVIVTTTIIVIVVTAVRQRLIPVFIMMDGIVAFILISRIMVVLAVKILWLAFLVAMLLRVLFIMDESTSSNQHNVRLLIL